MDRWGDLGPKILEVLALYQQHPAAVRTRLVECGLRWDDCGVVESWTDVHAVLSQDAPWGPVARADKGKDWVWYLPGFDQLVAVFEAIKEGNYIAARKDPKKFKRARRPWDKGVRKLAAKVMPIKQFDEFFASRFSEPDADG